MKIFSVGGGVQSVAALVLEAQHRINYHYFLFANVGEDSENPETLKYFREQALPFAIEHAITLVELRKVDRKGNPKTLYKQIMDAPRSIPLPAWLLSGAFGRRTCTFDFKIAVIHKWCKKHGATKDNAIVTGIGFSWEEYHRVKISGIQSNRMSIPF